MKLSFSPIRFASESQLPETPQPVQAEIPFSVSNTVLTDLMLQVQQEQREALINEKLQETLPRPTGRILDLLR